MVVSWPITKQGINIAMDLKLKLLFGLNDKYKTTRLTET